MPRPQPTRQVVVERYLARRIRQQREEREWTLEGLAQRMTTAGCPMDKSAVHRIEGGGRRITIDEAVAFAGVLGTPLEDLILHPSLATGRAAKLFKRWLALKENYETTYQKMQGVQAQLLTMVDEGYGEQVEAGMAVEEAGRGQAQLMVWRMLRGEIPVVDESGEPRG